eukprot:1260560-Karenia_brevis.AAC.1
MKGMLLCIACLVCANPAGHSCKGHVANHAQREANVLNFHVENHAQREKNVPRHGSFLKGECTRRRMQRLRAFNGSVIRSVANAYLLATA